MPINIGSQLGSYEIVALLGEGGMGRVFRAHDLRLKRDVAIKVLPEEFARDTERLARFQREAEALAALNHARIAAIYDLAKAEGSQFLVLELVEGKTLAERIAHGPMPLREALMIAKQIAEALEVAHEKGIVHRDLKPANIKILPDDQVKVLDFGLAKVRDASLATTNLSHSPTLVSGTMPGLILGTAAYMSPEQAKGKEADRTSDIWSFGAVLFEMLTGRPPFEGETITEILGGILKVEPDWSLLPAGTPASVRKLVARCLEKNRTRRLQHIGEARIAIDEVLDHPERELDDSPIIRSAGRPRLAWSVAALFAVAFAVALALLVLRPPATALEMRLEITTPPTSDPFSIAVSPDARKVAFVATSEGRPRLWLRPLNSVSAQPLARTENAVFPFWSPDSRSIGFFADDKMNVIDLSSGTVRVVTTGPSLRGATWNSDGTILFGRAASSIFRIPASGGDAVAVTKLKRPEEIDHRFPYFLPDGRHFLYAALASGGNSRIRIYAASLDGGEPHLVLDAETPGLFSSGYVLFARQGTLFAQKFDSRNLRVIGDPISVAKDLSYASTATNPGTGVPTFSASATGVIAYRVAGLFGARAQFVWFDRSGKQLGVVGEPGMGSNAVLSPDGRRLAMQSAITSGNADIWLYDIARNVRTRFTFDPAGEFNPIWSPDGSRIVFGSNRKALELYFKPATGVGVEELLLESEPGSQGPIADDWSRDGRFILYLKGDEKRGADIWALPLIGDRKPFPVVQTPFSERDGQFSPDVKWVAYASDETGQSQIYVQPFPTASSKWQVSVNGGYQPRWGPDGKELFYLNPGGVLMAVRMQFAPTGQSLEPGTPISLFMTTVAGGVQQTLLNRQQYVVSPDGQRFLIRSGGQDAVTLPITVLLNWPNP